MNENIEADCEFDEDKDNDGWDDVDFDRLITIEIKPVCLEELLKFNGFNKTDFYDFLEEDYQIHLGVGDRFSLDYFLRRYEYDSFLSLMIKSLDHLESMGYHSERFEISILGQRNHERNYARYWDEFGKGQV